MDAIRDGVLIAALLALATVALVSALALLVAGVLGFRVIRGLRRVHDRRVAAPLAALNARWTLWNVAQREDPSLAARTGLRQAVRLVLRRAVRPLQRRRKKRRSPLERILDRLPPLARLRP